MQDRRTMQPQRIPQCSRHALVSPPPIPRKRFDEKNLEELAASHESARDSRPSFGPRSRGKQVRSRRRGTSPKSGEAGGTRISSGPRGQTD